MSPCIIKVLTPEGLKDVDYTAESLADAVQYEPDDGVYTVTNTFQQNKVLRFDSHLDRLEDSANRAGIPLRLDRIRLRRALRQMLAEADFGDVRFRLTIPRENAHDIIVSMEPFTPLPPELVARGVRCITASNSGRSNARAKTTDWMHDRRALQEAMPEGIYDTILMDDDGNMLEGLSTNFYGIVSGELRTASEGVLPGIAQQVVFHVAPAILPVNKTAVNRRDLPRLEEAFITSSSRGVVPVVELDGYKLGGGVPGAKTMTIRHAYLQYLEKHLQEL